MLKLHGRVKKKKASINIKVNKLCILWSVVKITFLNALNSLVKKFVERYRLI